MTEIGQQFRGMFHTFLGKLHHFSAEEMKNNNYYMGKNAAGAQDVSDEEGRAFNERMRALTDYNRRGSISDETVPAQEKLMGFKIPVKSLHHSAPASRRQDILENGIRPKITDKVGSENYSKKRFGVFLANGYISPEAGARADVYRVNVPHEDLRVDSGYTQNGDNMYVERTIHPEELEHVGHTPSQGLGLNEKDIHPGFGETCATCDKQDADRREWYIKQEQERAARVSTPTKIIASKVKSNEYKEDIHTVYYASGHTALHFATDHTSENCPEIAKNPNVEMSVSNSYIDGETGNFAMTRNRNDFESGYDRPVYSGPGLAEQVGGWQKYAINHNGGPSVEGPGNKWGKWTALVPVAQLAKYVEFDRMGKDGGPQNVAHIANIANDLREKGVDGLREHIHLDYDHINKWAYLAEGHHRLAAAIQAGITHLPVQVTARADGYLDRRRDKGLGAPLHMDTRLHERNYDYHPAVIHPGNFMEFEGAR